VLIHAGTPSTLEVVSVQHMKAATSIPNRPKRGAHTVVLGCAKAQRGDMAPLIEAFVAQEHHVELVSGVEESRQRWREAGQRYGVRAVYVACGGPSLPPAELAALCEELHAVGIPPGSVWAAVVDWSQVDRLIRQVESMMEAVPVVVPAPPPLSAPASPSAPPPLSAVHAAGPSVSGGAGMVAPMLPPNGPRLAPVGPSLGMSSQVSLAPELVDDHGSGSLDAVVGRASTLRRVALALGAVATVTLGLAVAVQCGSDGDAVVAEAAVERDAPASAPADSAKAKAKAKERAVTGETAVDRVAADRASPASASDQAADVEPAELELSDAEPADAKETLPEDDDARVHAALMKRKIRALDILLISPEATRKVRKRARVSHMDWAGARAYCEDLDIGGVRGWRLPTAGEFRTLSTSNMLQRRSYWSATEADAFGSDRVVWNNLKKAMAPAPGEWKGGRVLCVRFQHPESFEPI